MKNFYLFLAGVALLASGMPFIDNTKEGFLYEVLVPKHAEEPAEVAMKQLPYSPLTKSRIKSRALLVPTISATNTYALITDGGLPGASAGDQLEYTVTISNTGTAATGVSFTEQIDPNTTLVPGSVKVTPIAVNETYSTIGNAGLNVTSSNGILANDVSPDGSALSITGPATVATSQGGSVTLNLATGAFVYEPKAGFTGSDTFTYTLQNAAGLTSTAIVTITSSNMIWFIKAGATAAGANGTFAKPFPDIASFQAINTNTAFTAKPDQFIFFYSGSYSGSLTLLSGQKVIGQAAAESLSTIVGITIPIGNQLPATGGTAPEFTSTGNAITLNQNNTVRGLNIGATTGSKISGSNYGTLVLKEMSLSGNGRALNLATGTLNAILSTLSSTVTADAGITITGTNGSLSATSGSISATNANAITISGKGVGDRLTLSLPFTTVSSSGTTRGVSVSNTLGTFQISGTGTTLGSGGTIQNIGVRGFEFINANGITLKNINLTNANTTEGAEPSNGDNSGSNAPVYANNVIGLTMDRIVITGTAVQQGINLVDVTTLSLTNSSVANAGTAERPEEGCIYAVNTQGTNVITGCTFQNAAGRVAYFRNTSKELTLLTVSGSTFQNAPNSAGLLFEGYGSAVMNLKVLGNSQFLACQTDGIEVYGNNNAQMNADIRSSVINNQGNVGKGIDIAGSGSSIVKFNIIGNTAYAKNGTGINMFASGGGYLEGNVENNTIEKNGLGGSGIYFDAEGATAKGVVKMSGNTVKNIDSGYGIGASVKSINATRSDVTISNNVINLVSTNAFYNVDVNAVGSYPNNRAKICANVAGNNATVNNGVVMRTRSGGTGVTLTEVILQGNAANSPAIWNINSNTPGGATTSNVLQGGPGTFTFNQTCAVPNVAALRVAAPEELAENQPDNLRTPALDTAETIAQKAVETVAALAAPVAVSEMETANEVVTYDAARTEAPLAGETVTVNGSGSGFTLPDGKSFTIKFRVLINAAIPVGTCLVSTQGSVSGTGFTTVLTDDPGKAGAANPTDTPVVSSPVITCPANVTTGPDAGTCTATLSPVATAVGCPVPTITYRVGGNVITFPYAFASGVTTVQATAENTTGPNAVCSFTVTVTPTPAPTINVNPVTKTICVGSNTSFTVGAVQSGVTYQWQKKPFGGAFANITVGQNATATSATLSLTNVLIADDKAEYRCIVANPCNNSTSLAAVLNLTQVTASSITGTTSIEKGKPSPPVTFGATGGTLPYTFKYKINGGNDQTVSTTGVQTTAVVNAPTTTEGIFIYALSVVTDNIGCTFTPQTAQTATITISPPLPVTLVDFTAAKESGSVLLQWKTTMETNSEKFDIEHSQDGKNWNVAGTRQSKGESSMLVKYSFTHNDPAPGENLYRLKMIDKDQTYAYSRIVSVSFDKLIKTVLYPNPVADQLYLNSADWHKVSVVEIHNLAGNLVYSSGKNVSKTISVKDLPAGMYIVSVIQKTGEVNTHKVVVSR